jgi:hypothetical protein
MTVMRILGMETENTFSCCGIPFDPACMFPDNVLMMMLYQRAGLVWYSFKF